MLKNQEAEQPSQTPSSQTPSGAPRVTPAELNAALAAIEARKQAEASRLAGTIPIDQAVADLHLDSTSDEIWAEVQAQRAAAAQPPRTATPVAASPLDALRQRLRSSAQERDQKLESQGSRLRSTWIGILPPILIGWVLLQTNVIPHFWNHTPAAAPILRPLTQEPDGKTVYADDAALVQISEGKMPAQTTISENATGNRWSIVKMGGHVYLHGYIASTNSLHPLQGKALDVYNDDDSGGLAGESTSKITLRVDNTPLQQSGGDDGYSEVTVPNFQPDPLTTLSDWR